MHVMSSFPWRVTAVQSAFKERGVETAVVSNLYRPLHKFPVTDEMSLAVPN